MERLAHPMKQTVTLVLVHERVRPVGDQRGLGPAPFERLVRPLHQVGAPPRRLDQALQMVAQPEQGFLEPLQLGRLARVLNVGRHDDRRQIAAG